MGITYEFTKRQRPATSAAVGLGLFFLNVSICWRLFFIKYTNHFSSVEPFFYAIAKAIRLRWPDLGWWPEWNLGMPFGYTYQPLLHYLVAAFSAISGLSEPRAYHIVVPILYSIGPAALYALALRLTGRLLPSLVAGLLYTFVSPSALLVSKIAADTGGLWNPRRLQTIIVYADAPNIIGLSFVPLAILFLDRALQRRTIPSWALAALSFAIVPLINIPATIAMSMAVAAYAFALSGKFWLRWLEILGVCVAGYLLFVLWLPPSGLLLMIKNIQETDPRAAFTLSKIPYYIGLPISIILIRYVLQKWRAPFFLIFASLFTLITATIALPSSWYEVFLIGQADRFHEVMEMAVVLLFVFAFAVWIRWTPPLRAALTVLLVIFCALQWRHHRSFVRREVHEPDVTNRSEYKVAQWMEQNAHGDRAYIIGSTAFWFNTWTNTPQVKGCCTQNVLLPMQRSAEWVIATDQATEGKAAEISTKWLQVLGAHYIYVAGPNSTDEYKDIWNPRKFNGVLHEAWRDGDDVIYEVPLASASLAHVVRPEELATRAPINGIDLQPFEQYRTAILDIHRPQARFSWVNTHEAVIQGDLPAGFIFSLQVPYHPGWHASTASESIAISNDALGFMTIAPKCNGPCEVRLRFDGGMERTVVRIVTILSWTILAFLLVWSLRKSSTSGRAMLN